MIHKVSNTYDLQSRTFSFGFAINGVRNMVFDVEPLQGSTLYMSFNRGFHPRL